MKPTFKNLELQQFQRRSIQKPELLGIFSKEASITLKPSTCQTGEAQTMAGSACGKPQLKKNGRPFRLWENPG